VLILLALLASSGCTASLDHATARQIPQIALLPLDNGSNDIGAPQKVRAALFKAMKERGFHLLPLEQIDQGLKEIGITLGGQLNLFDDRRDVLNQLVPADIYCYGAVIDFGFKNAVALTQRKVELKLKLVEARSGQVLFEGQEVGITTRAGLDATADAVLNVTGKIAKTLKDSAKQLIPSEAVQNAADLTDIIADVELIQEMNEAIRKLLDQFPSTLRSQ
jgi:hypothetical protein